MTDQRFARRPASVSTRKRRGSTGDRATECANRGGSSRRRLPPRRAFSQLRESSAPDERRRLSGARPLGRVLGRRARLRRHRGGFSRLHERSGAHRPQCVFDVGFVNNELSIAGFPSLEENGCTALCTLTLSRLLYPGIRHSLTDLCRYFGVDDSRRVKHGALLDAELLAEVTKSSSRAARKELFRSFPDESLVFEGRLLGGLMLLQGLPGEAHEDGAENAATMPRTRMRERLFLMKGMLPKR